MEPESVARAEEQPDPGLATPATPVQVGPCPSCGAALDTPLACSACGILLRPATGLTPFEIFGIRTSYPLCPVSLRRRLRRLTRLVHPDFFAVAGPEQSSLAETSGALLNDAYEAIADDVRRADWIVTSLGGPTEDDERQMPQAFLMEVLEWNETLEEAANARSNGETSVGESPALDALEHELVDRRHAILDELLALLDPLPPEGDASLVEARRHLNALRYLDRALSQIRALRSGQPI